MQKEGQILILIRQAYKCQFSNWVAFVLVSERKIVQASGQYNSMYEVLSHFLNCLNFFLLLLFLHLARLEVLIVLLSM